MIPLRHDLPLSTKARLWTDRAAVYGFAVLALFLIAGVFAASILIDGRRRESLSKLPERHGRARVASITLAPGRSVVSPIFHLERGEKVADIQTQSLARVGDTVRITYREDGSGSLFVPP